MPLARGMEEMDFGDIVLSWSIHDIVDDDLYKGQVETIPFNFMSLDHYLESYRAPLIEETRSDLCSCLDLIVEAPSSTILSMEETGKPGVYFMDVDFWDNGAYSSTGAPAVRNGGILILSSMKPEAVEDFNRYGVTYHLAIVTDVYTEDDDDDECQKGLKIKVAKDIGLEEDLHKLRYAISLSNIITNMWIWKALSFDKHMDNNFTAIESLLAPTNSGGDVCGMCVTQDVEYLSSFTEQLLSINLNKSQMDAIGSVIAALRCRHRNLRKLIWGPPGTGKTETASALLWALASLKCRTLTCAPTNIAVIRVCTRFLQNLKNFNNTIDDNGLPFSLGHVLLFGNKYNMDIPGDLQKVFLDFRVKELVGCFSNKSGWRCNLSSMISFFEDCGSQYDMLFQDDGSSDPVCFMDSLKKQFDVTAAALKRCIMNLWIHLPGRCFPHDSITNISALFNMLKKFETLLCDVDMIYKNLKRGPSDLSTENSVFLQPLSFIRNELDGTGSTCLKLLQDLQHSLNLPIGVDKNWVQRYCMRNAMLFFCTTSSSYRLHHMEIEPLDVLIVDEAAQVRECELVIPLRLRWLKHLILLGDDYQLSAMVKSQICKEAGFGKSLFERLVMLNIEKHLLNVQYRMNPSISSFPISQFYESKILDGPNVLSPSYSKKYTSLRYGSYAFVSVTDGKEDKEGTESSRTNMAEVAVVLHLIQTIFNSWRVSGQGFNIGVVSPYSCQVDVIKDRLGNKYNTCDGFHVGFKSIDGFQGEEDDIIIISTVRSNGRGDLGFLADNRRTYVALTRARHCLWIVGNATTLYKSGTVWKNLVDDALKRKCIFNASNDATMSKLISHVKHELGELDGFLNVDSAVFSNTIWKVVFSDGFRKSLIKLKSPQLKREVLQKLVKLGIGWRTTVKNFDMSNTFQLAKVYKIRDCYLIWNTDLEKKERRYFQILRIWDLLPHKHVARTVQRLENLFSLYTDDYLDHCRRVQTDGKLEVPMIWDLEHDIVRYKDRTVDAREDHDLMDTACLVDNFKVSESFLLMKFYSLSSGVAKHLLTAADGSEIDVPFELTDEEEMIIRFPDTSFTLGRSGTGKTTVLTMKLLRREQMSKIASPRLNLNEVDLHGAYNENILTQKVTSKEESFIKQVFITVSPKLCSAIKNEICRLKRFVSGDAPDQASTHHMDDIIDDMEQFAEIPDNFSDLPGEHYPLAITYHKFLMMLDGTCQTSFFDIFYGEPKSSTERGYSKSRALQTFIELKEVTYEKFSAVYWPHFNAKLTKKLDPSTVFTEIISHIKGGYQACRPITGKLERLEYVMLSDKRFSSLNSDMRERIYDIFLDYESMKCTAREFDLSDFVNSLHRSLISEGYNGDLVDFVYVDEVQDLTMTQIALLKYVCKNFEEGFHFAGDTAQTIARGIDFRFEDIRSLFYTAFLSETEACNRGNKHGKQRHLCDLFQLAQNFRTHCGILRMAQSIIDLLYFFFPSSVDKLNPETGLVYGEPPVLLETGNDKNAIVNIFGENESIHGNLHGFGAEQVIVVRDDATKQQIVDIVGKQALVLTIVECKGLEFQDVLLYNLFSTSPLRNKWRVVYGYMKNKDILSSPEEISHPDFDRNKHYLLCSELKQLYVAITRTRQRLWICENTDDYCRPMFDYWKRLCLVEVRLLDSSFIESMKTGSSTDDWSRRGTKLFNEGQFEMATMCFEKAGDAHRENWSRAAGLIATAESVMSKNFELGLASLQKASEIYESIGMHDKAATCYIKLGDYKRAGMLYMQNCGTSRLEDAGDCFAMTECWSDAGEAYFKAKCYTKCFSICWKGKLFNLGFQFLQQLWGETSSDESNVCVLYSPAAYGLIVDSLGAHLRPTNKKLTHGHLGRMAILLLHVVPWGDMLTSRLMQYLDIESEWANFFQSLDIFIHNPYFLEHIESHQCKGLDLSLLCEKEIGSQYPNSLDGRYSLLLNFKLALESTFKFTLNESWRAEPDFISPVCYVDLIECLGYFASSCFALYGCMISTESICLKMTQRKNGCRFLHICFDASQDPGMEKLALSVGRFIFESIRDLLTKKHMIQEWVRKTSTTTDSPILLRLVVTLYVVTLTLNVGDCYEVTRFLQMHRVFEDLPLKFSQNILGALQIRSRKMSKFRRLFADALLVIGERMTVVASPVAYPTFPGLNALVISSFEMKVLQLVDETSIVPNASGEEKKELCNLEKILFRKVHKNVLLTFEENRAGNRRCDVQFWEMFEAFQVNKQAQKDARAIVLFLKSVLSWVVQRGPPIKIDVHLLLEVRRMCDQFDKQCDDSAENRTCVTAKDLYSTWKDGEKKVKKIISFLRSEKASIVEERRNAAAKIVQSKNYGCSDSESETGAGNVAEEDADAPTSLSASENIAQKQKNMKKSKKCRRHASK